MFSIFSAFSMFSTCSELTPRAPSPAGRLERLMQPCGQLCPTVQGLICLEPISKLMKRLLQITSQWTNTAGQAKFCKANKGLPTLGYIYIMWELSVRIFVMKYLTPDHQQIYIANVHRILLAENRDDCLAILRLNGTFFMFSRNKIFERMRDKLIADCINKTLSPYRMQIQTNLKLPQNVKGTLHLSIILVIFWRYLIFLSSSFTCDIIFNSVFVVCVFCTRKTGCRQHVIRTWLGALF